VQYRRAATESYRYLRGGDKFSGVPEREKNDLKKSFGVTPIEQNATASGTQRSGLTVTGALRQRNTERPAESLLARSIESGSSVRQKRPFVRPALNAVKKQGSMKCMPSLMPRYK
jgi:hypothetical protein